MSVDRWFSRKETASHLGTSWQTVARMIDRKKLRGYKIGGVWKVRESDLIAYLEKAATIPETPPEWEQELEFRLHGKTIPGLVQLSAGDATDAPEDVLGLLSAGELDIYKKLARGGGWVYALQAVLAYAFGEREGWRPVEGWWPR